MNKSQVKALLEKLKKLQAEDRIFVIGNAKAKEMEKAGHRSNFERMAQAVIVNILEETGLEEFRENPSNVNGFIEEVEEFLAIF
ncbi:MAG: hypothetical protein UV40_C0009G0012 [Parcubacteria group bacterium GW2011_GWA1_42_7]|nr:MAG: hypothetical protein UV34_C0026G0006 [Parcubacteria group bacterium GW2011_GWB1_42_6]KKS69966.1 MAG: hypothetical protein UV40_C0009G0012 [Parcubacteria group bacterium GW2011_GWA1_42_7]KKS91630.1 MAG: hypothetical protein UV67_C0023G0006 [Parcubacteria group bacterium GW2011_GWC1_43_12]